MPGHITPTGRYEIANKAVDPAWSAPDRPWAAPIATRCGGRQRENPLKARWLGIVDGVGIHGTDVTGSLGTALRTAASGCRSAVKALYRACRSVRS